MAQVQNMAPQVGGDIPNVPPVTEALPPQVDSKNDTKENVIEQQEPGSEFEVLGLMRTTSYRTQNVASSRRKSQIDQDISAIPEKDHEEPTTKRSSITGLSLRSKIKEKLPNILPGSADKQEKGHQKHDSANPDPDFEVVGLMRTNTRKSEDEAPVEKKPSLERHISSIPQDDPQEEDPESSYDLTPKLRRHIFSIPVDDYDSEGEDTLDDEPTAPAKVKKHDSGTAGSDFEVHGLMRITSNDSKEGKAQSPLKRPGLERHISQIPQHDDDSDDDDSLLKSPSLVKTISNIPGHDYDSDGESPLAH